VPAASAISWDLPAFNLSAGGQNAVDPQVAIAPDGATTVTWERFNGDNNIIQAATRPAGQNTFGPPKDLSQAGLNAFKPQVAIAPDGATTVTWERFNGINGIIQAAIRPAGQNTFGPPQDLSATDQDAFEPQVAIAPDGATTVTWRRSSGINSIIQAATRPAGQNTFGTPQDLSATGQNAGSPQVAIAPDGATTVTWARSNGSNFIIQAVTSARATPPAPKKPTVKVLSAKAKVSKKSVLITSRVKVSGKGRISQRATTGKGKKSKNWCKTSKTVGTAGTYALKCGLGRKGRKALRKKALKLTLRTTFTPTVGKAVTVNRKLTVKRKR